MAARFEASHPSLEEINRCIDHVMDASSQIPGWMADRELRFLTWLAACPTSHGNILELGSYEGKSTVALAMGNLIQANDRLTTVDCRPPVLLIQHLKSAGVHESVDVIHDDSGNVARSWNQPLRLLWHDGANDYATVSSDFQSLMPHVVEGGIVAMHDVLNHSGERIQYFCRDVLLGDGFGAAGIVGSIGWAQRTDRRDRQVEHRMERARLARLLQPLIPYHNFSGPQRWSSKLVYKFWRSRVPHAEPDYTTWMDQFA